MHTDKYQNSDSSMKMAQPNGKGRIFEPHHYILGTFVDLFPQDKSQTFHLILPETGILYSEML
jgi:hypothetical protein